MFVPTTNPKPYFFWGGDTDTFYSSNEVQSILILLLHNVLLLLSNYLAQASSRQKCSPL